jgi:hypothetical protein
MLPAQLRRPTLWIPDTALSPTLSHMEMPEFATGEAWTVPTADGRGEAWTVPTADGRGEAWTVPTADGRAETPSVQPLRTSRTATATGSVHMPREHIGCTS